jgi:hypothetical protein
MRTCLNVVATYHYSLKNYSDQIINSLYYSDNINYYFRQSLRNVIAQNYTLNYYFNILNYYHLLLNYLSSLYVDVYCQMSR